jgi:hypothetical protein
MFGRRNDLVLHPPLLRYGLFACLDLRDTREARDKDLDRLLVVQRRLSLSLDLILDSDFDRLMESYESMRCLHGFRL